MAEKGGYKHFMQKRDFSAAAACSVADSLHTAHFCKHGKASSVIAFHRRKQFRGVLLRMSA